MQVQMFQEVFLCIAWVHIKSEACICKTGNSTLLLQTNNDLQIAKKHENMVNLRDRDNLRSEDKEFPKSPLFGGSTVVQ